MALYQRKSVHVLLSSVELFMSARSSKSNFLVYVWNLNISSETLYSGLNFKVYHAMSDTVYFGFYEVTRVLTGSICVFVCNSLQRLKFVIITLSKEKKKKITILYLILIQHGAFIMLSIFSKILTVVSVVFLKSDSLDANIIAVPYVILWLIGPLYNRSTW